MAISVGRSIGRIERDGDLDPPRVADDRDALVRRQLRADVKVRWRPPGNSSRALASRSVLNFGSQSIVATTRVGSAPKM